MVFVVAVMAHERAYIYGHGQYFYLDGYVLVTIHCIQHTVSIYYISLNVSVVFVFLHKFMLERGRKKEDQSGEE